MRTLKCSCFHSIVSTIYQRTFKQVNCYFQTYRFSITMWILSGIFIQVYLFFLGCARNRSVLFVLYIFPSYARDWSGLLFLRCHSNRLSREMCISIGLCLIVMWVELMRHDIPVLVKLLHNLTSSSVGCGDVCNVIICFTAEHLLACIVIRVRAVF